VLNVPAYTLDDLDGSPLLKAAVMAIADDRERLEYDTHSTYFKGLGNMVRLMDGIGSMIGGYMGLKMNGKTFLAYVTQDREIAKINKGHLEGTSF